MSATREWLHRAWVASLRIALIAVSASSVLAIQPAPAELTDPNGAWEGLVFPQPPLRRAMGYAFDSLRNRMLIFGGYPQFLNDVWALDAGQDRWRLIAAEGPPPSRRYGASAVYDAAMDRLIVFGGFDGTSQLNDTWELTLSGTPRWKRLSPAHEPPPGRSFHVAAYDPSHRWLFLFGGWNGSTFLGDTWVLSLGPAPAWQLAYAPGPPSARDLAAVTFDTARGRMVVFGGWNGMELQDTWTFSLSQTPSWQPLTPSIAPPARRECALAYDPAGDRLVVFGGKDESTYFGDTWELPLGGGADWQELIPVGNAPSARFGHAGIWNPVANNLVVFGGDGLDETWFMNSSSPPSWTSMKGSKAVRNYSLALDPISRQLLRFGGEIDGSYEHKDVTDRFESLSLSTSPSNWETVVPVGAAPGPRFAASAAWDPVRDRMLVFGGNDGYRFLNEIWEYRPRPIPVWSHLLPLGPKPAPRFAGGFIYDGKKDRLLAFGGYGQVSGGGLQSFNDLWELPLSGPAAMIWNPLAPTGDVPSPRWGAVMVPDPSRNRAVVFGGGAGTTVPTSQTFVLDLSVEPPDWQEIRNAGAPPPRMIHAGVIEPHGDRLVIFGGFANNQFLNDAWALPLSGQAQWSRLYPTGEVPLGRCSMSAVYDEGRRQMVVPSGFGIGPVGYEAIFPDTWAVRWDAAVPVAASLLESSADPGQVRMVWFVADAASVIAQVERHNGSGSWSAIGAPQVIDVDRLAMTDRTVAPGTRYAYRLRLNANGEETLTAETEIEVPTGYTLALAGAQPNPTQGGPLNVAFSLARAGDGRLELMDLAGRRVASRELRGLAPGQHRIVFAEGARAEPGVYLMRLVTKERTLTAKALITR